MIFRWILQDLEFVGVGQNLSLYYYLFWVGEHIEVRTLKGVLMSKLFSECYEINRAPSKFVC